MPDSDRPPITFSTVLSDSRHADELAGLLASPMVREINGKYRPWRKVRPIAMQAGMDPARVWAAVKLSRLTTRWTIPVRSMSGEPFGISTFPTLSEQLHRIDQACGGGPVIATDSPDGLLADPEVRERLVIRTMMEEAIESSRLEGAVTTRELAMDLLRSGRRARTPAEVMVANNYSAMQAIKSWIDRPLSKEMLCELQGLLVRGTLDDAQAGRFRRTDERVAVVDERTSRVVYTPPRAELLDERVAAVCDFANTRHTGEQFMHPVVKASILHFLIGHEHPFVDGNGRTARAVFYWYALRSGYRAFEYLTISDLIRAAYAKYPQAFADTEDDDGDLTYFVMYKLGVIGRAIERLHEYLREEEEVMSRSLRLVALDPGINLRQRLLLEHALRHPRSEFTAKSHARSSSITAMTARADLEHLRAKGFVTMFRVGREQHYVLSPDLPKLLAKKGT